MLFLSTISLKYVFSNNCLRYFAFSFSPLIETIFGDASFFQKLFGTGPDTFHYAFSPYFTELMKYGDSSTNAAHNEYLNYLITIGAFGLIAYLSVVGGTIAGAIKKSFSNPLSIVCVSAVICYSVQVVVKEVK